MATKGGLGKGLGALLGEDAVRQDQQQGQGTLTLPISQVQPGLNQPRKRFDEEAFLKNDGMECCECGCCSFICPAKRPLTQQIKSMRKIQLARKKK